MLILASLRRGRVDVRQGGSIELRSPWLSALRHRALVDSRPSRELSTQRRSDALDDFELVRFFGKLAAATDRLFNGRTETMVITRGRCKAALGARCYRYT